MKVQTSIRRLYNNQIIAAEKLKMSIDSIVGGGKDPKWHYESRIKDEKSFALKIETGRFQPNALEDFFACMLVVPNSSSIVEAKNWVLNRFSLVNTKPKLQSETHKLPQSFAFDDLRLYVKLGNDGSYPPSEIDELVFEIQIKTFLQHAWGVATHDLSYKSDNIMWGRDRIVAHLRATIEFAEIAIFEAENLAASPPLQLEQKDIKQIARILQVVRQNWDEDLRPSNLRGLAENIKNLLTALGLSVEQLVESLETRKRGPGLDLNLSPYGNILRILFDAHPKEIAYFLKNGNAKMKMKILITPELDLTSAALMGANPARLIKISD